MQVSYGAQCLVPRYTCSINIIITISPNMQQSALKLVSVLYMFGVWSKECTLGPKECDRMLTSVFVTLRKDLGQVNIFTDALSTSWACSGNIWQGNTFLQVKWTTGVGSVRRSQIQMYFSALSVNGIWFPGKSAGCSLPGSDSTAGFRKARFTVYFIREHPCNNNSSSCIKRGQGSPGNKSKTSKPTAKAIDC